VKIKHYRLSDKLKKNCTESFNLAESLGRLAVELTILNSKYE
jgi:hypothetical protein